MYGPQVMSHSTMPMSDKFNGIGYNGKSYGDERGYNGKSYGDERGYRGPHGHVSDAEETFFGHTPSSIKIFIFCLLLVIGACFIAHLLWFIPWLLGWNRCVSEEQTKKSQT